MQAVDDLLSQLDIASDHVSGLTDDPKPKEAKRIVAKVQKQFESMMDRIKKILGESGRGVGRAHHIRYHLNEAMKELEGNHVAFARDHLNSLRADLRDFNKILNSIFG